MDIIISVISLSICTVIAVVAIVALMQNRKYIIDQLKILNKQIEIQNEFEYDKMYTEIYSIGVELEKIITYKKWYDFSTVHSLILQSPRMRRYLPLTHYYLKQLSAIIKLEKNKFAEDCAKYNSNQDEVFKNLGTELYTHIYPLLDEEPKQLHNKVEHEIIAYQQEVVQKIVNGEEPDLAKISKTLFKISDLHKFAPHLGP